MQPKQDNFSTILSVLALVTSIAAAAFGYFQYRESQRATLVALEAVKTAKEANNIALGNVSAEVCIDIDEKPVTTSDTPSRSIDLRVRNCGSIPIAGVVVRVIPVAGLVYEMAKPSNKVRPLSNWRRHRVDFPEILASDGSATINLAPLLSASVKANLADFKQPSSLHRGAFNVVVAPILKGESIPSSGRGLHYRDRKVTAFDFLPSSLENLSIEEITKTVANVRILH